MDVPAAERLSTRIKILYGVADGGIAIILSLPLLIWYPVTRTSHARLRAELKKV